MLNFTVGPVMSNPYVIEESGKSAPYFRTQEFSKIMVENEKMLLNMVNAPKNSRCVFLTSSGTGAMESCVMNLLNKKDKVIVVNGGTFGQRFVDLCVLHEREVREIKVDFGKQLEEKQLNQLQGDEYDALLINMHETSSGVLYDMDMVSKFCKDNNIMLIIDAISSFISDDLDMNKLGAAAVITGSQKALALHPGLSIVLMSPFAIEKVRNNEEVCLYLSLKEALKNAERGQTPFTPAVSVILQLYRRLKAIQDNGGVLSERKKIEAIALDFREKIIKLPFDFVVKDMSNSVTALHPRKANATEIVDMLKDEYGIWVCPSGGRMSNDIFRVGHIGCISFEDNNTLIQALEDLQRRGVI